MENFDKIKQFEGEKDFKNGEKVNDKADDVTGFLNKNEAEKVGFLEKIKSMLGFSEKPEAGDMGKTNETKNLNEEEENDIKDEQGGAKLNTDVEKRGE